MTNITMPREALKLALEALESGVKTTANRISWTEYDCELMEQAITAIKEALAQPEQALDKFFEVENELGLHYDEKPTAQNFCPRCGKRTLDLTTIHTCTPPRGLEMT